MKTTLKQREVHSTPWYLTCVNINKTMVTFAVPSVGDSEYIKFLGHLVGE